MKKLLCIAFAVMMLLMPATLAETTELTVRGNGIVNTTADCARVILGVRETSVDVLEAQGMVNGKINAIVNALTEAGVSTKDIGTESMYIYANYDYSDDQRLTGYTATNTISIITQQMDKVGEYIDIAFGNGANTLDAVLFSAMDTGTAQKEALELAVQNAYEKAETIAAASGMEIVSIIEIDETAEYYGSDVGAKYSNVRAEAAAVDQSTLVQASTLQVSANIIVKFELSEVNS